MVYLGPTVCHTDGRGIIIHYLIHLDIKTGSPSRALFFPPDAKYIAQTCDSWKDLGTGLSQLQGWGTRLEYQLNPHMDESETIHFWGEGLVLRHRTIQYPCSHRNYFWHFKQQNAQVFTANNLQPSLFIWFIRSNNQLQKGQRKITFHTDTSRKRSCEEKGQRTHFDMGSLGKLPVHKAF